MARKSYMDALAISTEHKDTLNIAEALEGMAMLALSANDPASSLVLVGAAEALRALTGGERTPEWTDGVIDTIDRAQARLSKPAVEAARRRGAAMSMEEAVHFALGEAGDERRDGKTRLTEREIEVARLIAEGLTNSEVASKLHISNRTVDAHVEHIRNKVGLRTRAQIAVWAHERLGAP